jgi:hypothetical protein
MLVGAQPSAKGGGGRAGEDGALSSRQAGPADMHEATGGGSCALIGGSAGGCWRLLEAWEGLARGWPGEGA